ncbi:phosphate ABC transporter substrate-binding protein PstS [Enterobacter kobei]|uniref:phosphate ABC transporter substrate-binding protein PstS n=1 Tax=Enterobacter TaxID=547 RepID=UPI002002C825|nr:phosphate ABC transporter substrate-binding protein PstS [Enterobacter kobei]MCK7114410.1 phosphate ABC transporter substrate-binding protein PstS [Enterobacter kobei]
MSFTRNIFTSSATIIFSFFLIPAHAVSGLTGAGGTFPAPIYEKWAAEYRIISGKRVNYQGIGSSGGIRQIKARTIDFAGTDIPLKDEELDKLQLFQFPAVIGGVVVAVNIPGISSGDLILDGAVLGDIYLGNIRRWNDKAITRLNPGLNLPDIPIAVIRRADGSGTTYIFTRYLSKVNPEWNRKIGAGANVNWPTGMGGKGNSGVAVFVQRVRGAIGFVEYSYAKPDNMSYTRMINADGKTVNPSQSSFSAAGKGANWGKQLALDLTNQKGENAWPITAITFILIHKQQINAARGSGVLNFFDWSFHNGHWLAQDLDYAMLPDSVINNIRNSWRDNITDGRGQPLLDKSN